MEYKELSDEVSRVLKARNRMPEGVSLDNFTLRFEGALRRRMIKRKSLREELLERIWFVLNLNPQFRFRLAWGMACALLLFLLGNVYFISSEVNSYSLEQRSEHNLKYVTVNIDSPNVLNHEIYPSAYTDNKTSSKAGVHYVSAHEPYLADASLAF